MKKIKLDKQLLLLMILFTIFGLVMIFSASSITAVLHNGVAEHYYFKKQLYIIIATWFIGMFVLVTPTKTYRALAPIGMIAIVVALAALFPYATLRNSVRSWYDLGFFSLQPSEFAKSITIVFLAVVFDNMNRKKNFNLNIIMLAYVFVLVAVGLILKQPDLGTAVILAGIGFGIFMSLPFKTKEINNFKKIGLITGAVLLVFLSFFGKNFLTKEQLSRLTYKAPCTRYKEKTGYQVCNGFIAISNGGLLGSGLADSTQKYLYLPEAHTDFIFPVIIEELGALAGIVIICCFLWLLYRLYKIAVTSVNLRGSIIAYGTFLLILLHLLVNFMGILAIIPLTGVPVPFLSYGGSFYINIMFMLFLTQRVEIENNETKKREVLK